MIEADETGAPMRAWLAMPMETQPKQAIERVRRADDVMRVAVMPDVHVAGNFCVGVAVATRRLIYPAAVGGDIGCGMLAMAFDASADALRDPGNAGAVLRSLGQRIPAQRRHRSRALQFPAALKSSELSHTSLRSLADDEGQLQFGTLGGGNHFVEMQADEVGRLWLMIHSGSRAVGQAVKDHHMARATIRSSGMVALDSDTPHGQAYLHDQEWARRFAHANREAMAGEIISIMKSLFQIDPIDGTTIVCDHNHVCREEHYGEPALVHRKGAMPAKLGLFGVVPGSMGTLSYHVEGRGRPESLLSSAHGAGRLFSRHAARERFGRADLRRQMQGIRFDPRLSEALREESPGAYKDVESVMRAQHDLVKVVRTLRPLLVYKGR
ncbi:MAG TPA: RtcB family protein [Tepidisphaeraceae bacterium]|jgi:tRNA-splicing ligase RtcB|nr:RtcB family protein [Tepidisphaeraceae bacterium]